MQTDIESGKETERPGPPSLEQLWAAADFKPNDEQQAAIKHVDGPLFLKAGPGSGKTHVLLWRALHLIIHKAVRPEDIFLATFTEKAALQLKEGLRSLMEHPTKSTGKHIDLSNMYVGTIHSLCQRMLRDRRFSPSRRRPKSPVLLDELAQYLFLYRKEQWKRLLDEVGWTNANAEINLYFDNRNSSSRHLAVTNCIALFNRLSEECVRPDDQRIKRLEPEFRRLVRMYDGYRRALISDEPPQTDFALLQQAALKALEELDKGSLERRAGSIFKHVIIDEYQDTNTIQEKLIFKLASGHRNVCVVGDDDQALYRFRGATVENLVEFPGRCRDKLGTKPAEITLVTNYRSRKTIVDFYKEFITHPTCDWSKGPRSCGCFRVHKDLIAHRKDSRTAVVMSRPDQPEAVCAEIASLVRKIIDQRKVEDPNQIAFLYPSLKSKQVERMMAALEAKGLKVYAPRARTFLDVDEAVAMMGLFLHLFGKPDGGEHRGTDYENYLEWIDSAYETGKRLIAADTELKDFISMKKADIASKLRDYETLRRTADQHGWEDSRPYEPEKMRQALLGAPDLSKAAIRTISSSYLRDLVERRRNSAKPFLLGYVIKRATSLDWNTLDIFYRLCGFRHFRRMFDLAQSEGDKDEGPVCNLSLLSQYLARHLEYQNITVIDARFLADGKFRNSFFMNYLYALYRRGESEYEDAQDPFPRGRIPFLTIHQAKGLEFPVVVLGNPRKRDTDPQRVEELIYPLLDGGGEPLEKMPMFDVRRMFYVALSRAQNLLVIAYYRGRGQSVNEPFKSMLDGGFPQIGDLDVKTLPEAEIKKNEFPRTYSYTGDFLHYKRCPRQYMIFRKYGFAPARSLTMFFGSLVHETIDDLHNYLLDLRSPHEH